MSTLSPFAASPLDLLIVEDDPNILALLDRWLPPARYRTTATSSIAEATAALATGDHDIVLSDMWLPDGEGLGFIERAKRARPMVPTALMTSDSDIELAVGALQRGVDDFLRKPLGRTEVVSRIDALSQLVTVEHRGETVLAIGAHPDDVEIGCGATLLRHRAQGHRIVVLTLSGGEVGGPAGDRRIESCNAAALLGAELVHLDLPDTRVSGGAETIAAIESVIRRVRPTHVYTHTRHDLHQDHRAVYRASLVAARKVPNVYCYQSPSSTPDFRPTRFVDVTPFVPAKQTLIDAYASQATTRAYLEPEAISATARYWARYAGVRAAEPFEVVRECPTMRERVGIRAA